MAAGRKKGTEKTGGRRKGTPNKSTVQVRAYAQEFGEDAISILADLMYHADDDRLRVSAAKEILDRGYGKAPQAMAFTGRDSDPIQTEDLSDKEAVRLAAYFLKRGADQDDAALWPIPQKAEGEPRSEKAA